MANRKLNVSIISSVFGLMGVINILEMPFYSPLSWHLLAEDCPLYSSAKWCG
uniref:Uncharacterized protein n=1 Tax=Picea glauca TaxID=3330 RepID=A0A101M586_PICGL|nr:hypothetical protein ABT39_MTgene960 [Picea glauca]